MPERSDRIDALSSALSLLCRDVVEVVDRVLPCLGECESDTVAVAVSVDLASDGCACGSSDPGTEAAEEAEGGGGVDRGEL